MSLCFSHRSIICVLCLNQHSELRAQHTGQDRRDGEEERRRQEGKGEERMEGLCLSISVPSSLHLSRSNPPLPLSNSFPLFSLVLYLLHAI